MTFRDEVAIILGIRVRSEGWKKTFESLEVSGQFDLRKVNRLVALLCERVDALEKDETNLQPFK